MQKIRATGFRNRGFCVSADVEQITADSYRELNDGWADGESSDEKR